MHGKARLPFNQVCGTDGRSQVRPKCVFTLFFALSKGKAPGGFCERCRSLCKTASSLVVTATSLGNGLQICFADFYEYQLAGTIPMIWSQSVRRTYGAPLFSIKVSGLMTQSISVCVGADMYLLRVQSFRDWCTVGTSKVCIICCRSWRMPLFASKCHLSSVPRLKNLCEDLPLASCIPRQTTIGNKYTK